MKKHPVTIDFMDARIIAGMLRGYAQLLASLEPVDNAICQEELSLLVLSAEAKEALFLREKLLRKVNA